MEPIVRYYVFAIIRHNIALMRLPNYRKDRKGIEPTTARFSCDRSTDCANDTMSLLQFIFPISHLSGSLG